MVIIGFVFEFLSPYTFKLHSPDLYWELTTFYTHLILNWVLPALLVLLVGIWMFSSQLFNEIWYSDDKSKKFLSVVGGIILLIITSIISGFILFLIGLANGSYSF